MSDTMGDGSGLRLMKHAIVDPAKVRTRTVECGAAGQMVIFNGRVGAWEVDR